MGKRSLILGAVLVLVLGLVAVAAANPSEPDSENRSPRVFGLLGGLRRFVGRCFWSDPPTAPDLGLTDEQADAIAALLDREHDLKETLRREISEKQNELRKLLWQKEPDQAAIDAKWEELQALREELFSKTQGLGEAMDEVLTDELLDKLSELRLGGEVPGGCGMGRGNMPRFRGGKDLEIRARGF